jgi:fatty-acyl-CoA synthase
VATTPSLAESYWPADTSHAVNEATVTDLLRQAAAEVPDRTALVEMNPDAADRPSWTYAELAETAEQVARALLARFEPGERVAIWAPNCARWVLLQQGLSMAGVVLVTVNPAYRDEELEYVLRQSRAAGIFFADEYRGVDMAATVQSIRERLPELREAVSLKDWDAFVAGGDASTELPAVTPDHPVQIQYTSGTTGFPKGALLHQRGIVNASAFVAERSGFEDGGIWINAMPMFHIGGGGLTEIGTMNQRGTYVLLPFFEPGLVLEAIEEYRGTMVLAVPTMLIAMLDHPDAGRRDTSSLQTVMSGASAVPAALVRRAKEAYGCRFTIVFGQTELHGVISQTQLQDGPEQQAETVGQPLPQVEVKIADPDTGAVLPLGEQGEICARGYQTMHEYFEMPDETAATLRDDGWLHMGDLGTMDENGYLRITGRLKDMIIRGGENIYPREIEERLFEHPEVGQVAVLGMADEAWGEQVVAVICAADAANPPAPADLRAYCRERLAKYKTPAGWCFVESFPLTPSGKVQKFLLRQQLDNGDLVPTMLTSQDVPAPSDARGA